METILLLLCCFALNFIVRDIELLDRPRNWLTGISVFAWNLLNCPFCTGFHTGYITYLAFTPPDAWTIRGFMMLALASAGLNYIIYHFLLKDD